MSGPDWNAVHARMQVKVRRVARSVLRDEHEAEDAVQDAFVRGIRSVHRLKEPAALTTWFLVVARRAALDRLRKLRRRCRVSETPHEVEDRRGFDAVDALTAEEILSRLPPSQRRALDHKVRGLTLAQAAAAEGISVAAAKTRLFRARAFVRRMVLS